MITTATSTQAETTVADAVARSLRTMIGSGELRAGDAIVIERTAHTLGVSTQPVREALKILEAEGRVSHSAHRGVSVLALSREELLELYQIRHLIEGEAIRRSVERFEPAAIDELETLTAAMHQAAETGDPDDMQQLNRRFHEVLRSFNDNTRLDGLVVQLRASSAPYRRRYLEQRIRWPELVVHHQSIVDALRVGDVDAVLDAAKRQRLLTVEALGNDVDAGL